MAALFPMSVAPSPPEVSPPTNRPGSAMTARLPMRLACTAAAMPPDVPPNTHTSVSMISAPSDSGRRRTPSEPATFAKSFMVKPTMKHAASAVKWEMAAAVLRVCLKSRRGGEARQPWSAPVLGRRNARKHVGVVARAGRAMWAQERARSQRAAAPGDVRTPSAAAALQGAVSCAPALPRRARSPAVWHFIKRLRLSM